ncbi:MAG: PilN domain-containing protein [Bdellovibrionales bacterium]|nr:PilN domain-containing protein [Bdellovibrionales bacterium]
MIKVNLLRNKVNDGPTLQSVGPGGSHVASSSGASAEMREALIKVAFLLMFTVILMFFESQNLRNLQAEAVRLSVRVTELEAQAVEKAKEVEAVKDIETQARELEDKLKILRLLSRLRLREVKTLDFIQSSIPEKVWLKTLVYESDKDRVEFGKFNFAGNAVTTEDLTEFVKRLEDSAYLYEVIVMKNQEVPIPSQKNVMRDFQFTAQVEVKP